MKDVMDRRNKLLLLGGLLYEFMITFAPLPVEGGTGSPLNPLAIF